MFFRLFTSVKQKKKSPGKESNLRPSVLHHWATETLQRVSPSGSSYMKRVLRVYITGSLIPFTNVTVATSLILTVRRQRVLLELRNGPRSPWSLSVVEHRSAESEDLKFDSSKGLTIFFFVSRLWQDKNIILQIYVLILDCYYNQQRDIVTVQGLQV